MRIRFGDMVEKELIEGSIQGKADCQEKLFRSYSRRVLAICMRYAKTSFEAEDVMQETFIRMFKNLSRYQFTGSFEAWVKRIAVNTAIEFYRKDKRLTFLSADYDPEILNWQDTALDMISADEIMSCMQFLPEGYRMVFNLYAIEGYSHKEIGEMLGISEGTSKSQYARSRGHLQKLLLQKLNLNASGHKNTATNEL